jgi:hypothetical protein
VFGSSRVESENEGENIAVAGPSGMSHDVYLITIIMSRRAVVVSCWRRMEQGLVPLQDLLQMGVGDQE